MTEGHRIQIEELLAESGWVRALVRTMVRDPDLVDDVVQETWLRALQSAPRAQHGRASRRRWLGTVARRIVLRRRESEAARRRREQATEVDDSVDPAQLAERVALQRDVAYEVLQLDEPHRTAVILRFQEGLSSKQIAERLGITDDAARKRIARGIARLRHRMEARYGKGRDGWMAALMPLWQWPAAAPTAVASTSWAGVLLVAGMVAAAAAVAFWLWPAAQIDPNAGAAPVRMDRQRVADGVEPNPAGERELVAAPLSEQPPAQSNDPFAELDRDRDLHGTVRDASGTPVVSALVRAFAVDHGTYLPEQRIARRALLATETDAEGRFRLRLEPDQQVDLRVSASGFGEEWLPDRDAGERVDVTLASAATLVGRVVDDRGGPLANVPVRLVRLWLTEADAREIGRATTAADGTFRFEQLAAGRAALEFATPAALARPEVVEIEAGERLERTFALPPVRPLSLQVVDAESGAPVASARVGVTRATAYPKGAAWRPPSREHAGQSWADRTAPCTDAAGELVLPVPRDYAHVLVTVSADGYAPMALPANDVDRLRFALRRGGEVRGRLVDADGRAVAGAEVAAEAFGVVAGLAQGQRRTCATGADGLFVLSCLRTDLEVHLVARAAGRATAVRKVAWPLPATTCDLGEWSMAAGARVRGRVHDRAGRPCAGVHVLVQDRLGAVRSRVRSDDLGRFSAVDLPAGKVRLTAGGAAIEVALEPGAVVEGVQLEISAEHLAGVVRDPNGRPIHNAMVLLLTDRKGQAPARQVTDVHGRFVFRSPAGERFQLVVAPNSVHLPGGDCMVHQVRVRDVLPGPAEVSVVLPWAAVTRGVVVDARGAPCARTLVFARSPAGELLTYDFTAEDGTFVLRLPPGATADLCVGKDAPRTVVLAGVRAGATGVRVVRAK